MNSGLTQRRLAKLTGVSYPTVNRALNDLPGVRDETRQRILDAAKRYGYRKNHIASSLSRRQTRAIGLIIANSPHSYWAEFLEALERQTRSVGYHVVICHPPQKVGPCHQEFNFLIERQVDAVITSQCDPKQDSESFLAAAQAGVPILMLETFAPGLPVHFLGTDSQTGATDATKYLIELGHRDIAFIGLDHYTYTNQSRRTGYERAMHAAGLTPRFFECEGWDQEYGEAIVSRILEAAHRPTAIVSANDPLAIGMHLGFRRHGLRIPDDISIVGYARMNEGQLLDPPLTAVWQNVQKMGQRAGELIIELVEKKRDSVFEQLPDELMIGGSSAPPRRTPNAQITG